MLIRALACLLSIPAVIVIGCVLASLLGLAVYFAAFCALVSSLADALNRRRGLS